MLSRSRVVLSFAAVLLCGCNLEPDVAGERYVLRSIAGIALPAPYAQNPQHTARILADTIVLREDGTGEWRALIEQSLNGPAHVARVELTYTQDGDDIAVSFVCKDGAACVAPPHYVGEALSGGDRIEFRTSRVTRAPLIYARIGK
jgi:hypothetical protein